MPLVPENPLQLFPFEPGLQVQILEHGVWKSLAAGDTFLSSGDGVRSIPLLTEGCLKVVRENESGQELLLYYIFPGQACAMTFTCCMSMRNSEISILAEEDSRLLAIPVAYMEKWMQQFPSWKSFVMENIRERFQELLKTIDSVAFHKLDERLADYLKEKARVQESPVLNLTHQQIADELATSRVVISRLLKQLELQNKILIYRNQIRLLEAL